jgi:hypothetical protein
LPQCSGNGARKKAAESIILSPELIWIRVEEEADLELVTGLNVVSEVLSNSEASIDHILLRLFVGAQ